MRRSKTFAATALAGTLLATALAVPASAADGTQLVTVSVGGGALTVTAPAAVTALNPAGGALGSVIVADLRVPGADWTLSVKSTDFTATVPVEATIAASNAKMWVSAPIVETLTTTATTHTTAATALTLSNTAQTFVTTSGSETGNTATIVPSMSLDTTGATAAIYTATVTYTAL